jgi:hypothetical protein
MDAFAVILQFSLVILVMANGLAIIMGGPQAAGRLNRWVGRTLWRIVGGVIGWALRSLANLFDGRGR